VKHTGSHETSLPKRICVRKLHGAVVYAKTHQSLWEDKYYFIKKSTLFPTSHFFCKVCYKDVSITHLGDRDIERHAEGKIHQQRVKSGRNQSRLSFGTTSDSDSNKVTAA